MLLNIDWSLSSIADENAPLLAAQPPLSARSSSSASSPAAAIRARNSNPVVQADITLAPTQRARASGIQEHSGVSTRATRAQTGEPHTELQQTRTYYRSDHPDYRRGQYKRNKHEEKNKVRPLEGPLNLDSPYNQGYFGSALNQLFSVEGVQPRQVKPGPKKK